MFVRRYSAHATLIALVCLVAFCALGSLVALADLARPIRTHSDAVAYALQQRDIAYTEIQLTSTLSGIPGYNHFPGERHPFAVQIMLANGLMGQGVLDCNSNDNGCVLTVASLNLARVSVPDRATGRIWPLWDAIASIIERVVHSFGYVG